MAVCVQSPVSLRPWITAGFSFKRTRDSPMRATSRPSKRRDRGPRRVPADQALRNWGRRRQADKAAPVVMGLGNFIYQHHEKCAVKYRKRKMLWTVPERHEYYMDRFDRHTASGGSERVEALKEALRTLDEWWPRSIQQKQAHEQFIHACLPQIYGDELEPNLERILKMIGQCQLQKDVMVCWPRRMGKTMAISLFAAAYMLTQPSAEIVIYSNAKRASSMMSKRIYQMVVRLAGGAHVVKRSNEEDLVITNWAGSISQSHAYPSASKISLFPSFILVGWEFSLQE